MQPKPGRSVCSSFNRYLPYSTPGSNGKMFASEIVSHFVGARRNFPGSNVWKRNNQLDHGWKTVEPFETAREFSFAGYILAETCIGNVKQNYEHCKKWWGYNITSLNQYAKQKLGWRRDSQKSRLFLLSWYRSQIKSYMTTSTRCLHVKEDVNPYPRWFIFYTKNQHWIKETVEAIYEAGVVNGGIRDHFFLGR